MTLVRCFCNLMCHLVSLRLHCQVTTGVKHNTRNPKWRSSKTTFELLVQEPRSQKLRVVMKDVNMLNIKVSGGGGWRRGQDTRLLARGGGGQGGGSQERALGRERGRGLGAGCDGSWEGFSWVWGLGFRVGGWRSVGMVRQWLWVDAERV